MTELITYSTLLWRNWDTSSFYAQVSPSTTIDNIYEVSGALQPDASDPRTGVRMVE